MAFCLLLSWALLPAASVEARTRTLKSGTRTLKSGQRARQRGLRLRQLRNRRAAGKLGARMKKPVTIAIDGPAGVGKSSTAKMVARTLGYTFVDTGACYRALALLARERGISWTDPKGLARLARDLPISFYFKGETHRVRLDGKDVSDSIRAPEVSQAASVVAGHPQVRKLLVALQRKLAGKGGAVLEGRDIGTNVFPEAQVKIFLSASPEARARRHHGYLRERGQQVAFKDILKQIKERDRRDTTRKHSPLVAASDAIKLDTTHMSFMEVVNQITAQARRQP